MFGRKIMVFFQFFKLQYWPIYYGFKKNEKLKYHKKLNDTSKKMSVFVRETNEEENAKIAAFNFENCQRR